MAIVMGAPFEHVLSYLSNHELSSFNQEETQSVILIICITYLIVLITYAPLNSSVT